eukprot:SAG31_NODE_295_length_18239_cov_15.063065_16_plen_47_part_00
MNFAAARDAAARDLWSHQRGGCGHRIVREFVEGGRGRGRGAAEGEQ